MGNNNSANVTINADGTVTMNGSLTADITQADGSVVQNKVSVVTTSDPDYIPGDNEIAINATTGELLLGQNVYKSVYQNDTFSVTYEKSFL